MTREDFDKANRLKAELLEKDTQLKRLKRITSSCNHATLKVKASHYNIDSEVIIPVKYYDFKQITANYLEDLEKEVKEIAFEFHKLLNE